MRCAVFLDLLEGVPQFEASNHRQQNHSGCDSQTRSGSEVVASQQDADTRNGKPGDTQHSTVLRVCVEDPPQATDARKEEPYSDQCG